MARVHNIIEELYYELLLMVYKDAYFVMWIMYW